MKNKRGDIKLEKNWEAAMKKALNTAKVDKDSSKQLTLQDVEKQNIKKILREMNDEKKRRTILETRERRKTYARDYYREYYRKKRIDEGNIPEEVQPSWEKVDAPQDTSNYNPRLKGTKRTYQQDWEAYNLAQTNEKIYLIYLLKDLLDHIPFPEIRTMGRRPINIKEKIFYLVLQAYNTKSSRRCISDLKLCQQAGFVSKACHFNTILNCLKDTTITTYLQHLITVSGLPLRHIEDHMAIDSSGFALNSSHTYFDYRYGDERKKREFVKAHICVGTKTGICTSAIITVSNSADVKELIPLIEQSKKVFDIKRISADKAYLKRQHFALDGIIPYIPFKKGQVGIPHGFPLYKAMYELYKNNPEYFFKRYRARERVENSFFRLKTLLNEKLRTHTLNSQTNEVLARCLTYNLLILAQEAIELRIDLNFEKCAEIPIAQK